MTNTFTKQIENNSKNNAAIVSVFSFIDFNLGQHLLNE